MSTRLHTQDRIGVEETMEEDESVSCVMICDLRCFSGRGEDDNGLGWSYDREIEGTVLLGRNVTHCRF